MAVHESRDIHADRETPPRLGLNRRQAAESLGMSMDSFERYVQPELKLVRRGRMRIVPVGELKRWLAENADPPATSSLRRRALGSD